MQLKDMPSIECMQHFARRVNGADVSAIETVLVLIRTASELSAAFDAHFARHELSRGRFMILMLLMRQESQALTPAEIADACCVTRATVTGLIDTLEASALVERTTNQDDRRNVVVRITPKGIAHIDGMLPDHLRRMSRLVNALSQDERRTLVDLLLRIRNDLPAVRDP